METKTDKSFDLADVEAYRTGELEKPLPSDILNGSAFRKTLGDLAQISESFRQSRPGPEDIPETVDRAVLSGIQARASKIRRNRKIIRLFPKPLIAVAATILVCLCLWPFFSKGPDVPDTSHVRVAKSGPDFVSSDIDGDGSVTIVDAYLLAKRIEAGRDMPGNWDFNDDGLVDAGDVNEIARTSVSLGTEET